MEMHKYDNNIRVTVNNYKHDREVCCKRLAYMTNNCFKVKPKGNGEQINYPYRKWLTMELQSVHHF